jgi:hypothetical protein
MLCSERELVEKDEEGCKLVMVKYSQDQTTWWQRKSEWPQLYDLASIMTAID